MPAYIECQNCDFVLLSGTSTEPQPKGSHDSCPNCDTSDFRFTDQC